MVISLTARIERFAVRGAFVIARGAKTHVDVVVAEVTSAAAAGRGEATAIYYRGESAESVLAAVLAQADAVAAGASRGDLLGLMPAGAARNAIDAALWDHEAKSGGQRVWQLLGLPHACHARHGIDVAQVEAHAIARNCVVLRTVRPSSLISVSTSPE